MKLKKIFLGAGATLGAVTLVGCGNGGSEKYIESERVIYCSYVSFYRNSIKDICVTVNRNINIYS